MSSMRPRALAMTWPAFAALPDQALLTRRELAALLSCSERQVARLDLPCIKLGDVKLVRFAAADVRQWLEARKATPALHRASA